MVPSLPSCILTPPPVPAVPMVFASPHSGRFYPPGFVAQSRLDPTVLRRSEDVLVDELFACVPIYGAPLLAAQYARAFCDLNREPYELDPAMFSTPLPPVANSRSPRVAAGLGTIPRTVGAGLEIYHGKLRVAEIEQRLQLCYFPYHQQLEQLIHDTKARFGTCLLVDCHSMPSMGASIWGESPVDVVLGDNHGTACDPAITQMVQDCLTAQGYHVQRNHPYAGGFSTCHYGRPAAESHALQIEINRALYLDETGLAAGAGFPRLAAHLDALVQHMAAFMTNRLGPM